jgi:hypothetical protein
VISFGCTLLGLGALAAVGFAAHAFDEHGARQTQYLFAFLGYLVTYFVGIYFNAAVVGAASMRMDGKDPTIGDGLRMANARLGKIFGWALLSASVGMLLRMISERSGLLGKIVVGLVGAAWGVVTFFVVPVLLFEPLSVGGSVRRSAQLFKKTWGEQFVGNGSIGLVLFLLWIPVIAVGVLLALAVPVLGIVVMLLAIGALAAAGGVLSAIFNTALYRYAAGVPQAVFAEDDMRAAFRPKKG